LAIPPKSTVSALAVPLVVMCALVHGACDDREAEARKRMTAEYDKSTGRLTLLKYDSNGNGVVDTWSYMDGARVVRIEIDKDEDGKIDRWEYYGPDQKLLKVGESRMNDGKPDAWTYTRPDGSIDRVELSTRRDGKVTRVERYQQNALVAAEEDGDGDGRTDRWETYDGPRLASVAFDTHHRGAPDRRLTYGADGSVRVEVDEKGDGRFSVITAGRASPQSAIRSPR
jgi:hypothetical protein